MNNKGADQIGWGKWHTWLVKMGLTFQFSDYYFTITRGIKNRQMSTGVVKDKNIFSEALHHI